MWGHASPCGCPLCRSLTRCLSLIREGINLPEFYGRVTDRVRLLEGALRDDLGLLGIGETPTGIPIAPGVPLPQAPALRPAAPQAPPAPEAPTLSKAAAPVTKGPTPESLQTTPKYPPPERKGVEDPGQDLLEVKQEKDGRAEEKKEAVANPLAEEEKGSPKVKDSKRRKSRSRRRREKKKRKHSRSSKTGDSPTRASSSRRKRKEKEPETPRKEEVVEAAEEEGQEKKGEKPPSPKEGESKGGGERSREPVPEPEGDPPPHLLVGNSSGSSGHREQGTGWRGTIPYSNHPRWTKGVNKGLTKRAKQELFGRKYDRYYEGRR